MLKLNTHLPLEAIKQSKALQEIKLTLFNEDSEAQKMTISDVIDNAEKLFKPVGKYSEIDGFYREVKCLKCGLSGDYIWSNRHHISSYFNFNKKEVRKYEEDGYRIMKHSTFHDNKENECGGMVISKNYKKTEITISNKILSMCQQDKTIQEISDYILKNLKQ